MKEPVWHFCESSKPLLQRCIDTASRNNSNTNKWLKYFTSLKRESDINGENIEKMAVDEEVPASAEHLIENQKLQEETQEKDSDEPSGFILSEDINDFDPVNGFEEVLAKCLQNPKTFLLLAKNLPLTAIEKLCNHIFSLKDLNATFIENFYKLFLPELFKRDNTHIGLDFLVKSKKFHSNFTELLSIIINDMEMPKHVLLEYTSTLDREEKFQLLNYICQNVSKDVFLRHMHAVHTLYKECNVTEDIQRYILLNLKLTHEFCLNDKIFGKFLFNFLQTQKKFSVNCSDLEKIVNSHTSVFKKPCLNALNDIKKQNLSQN